MQLIMNYIQLSKDHSISVCLSCLYSSLLWSNSASLFLSSVKIVPYPTAPGIPHSISLLFLKKCVNFCFHCQCLLPALFDML